MSAAPWKQLTSMGIAAMGLSTVCVLAGMHVIQDGETTAGIASVLSAAVAIWHKDSNDSEGGKPNG